MAWWLIDRFVAFRPKGRGFESRSSRHVGTFVKSFTHTCLWRFAVKLRQGTPLKLPSNLESIFLIQTVGTSRPFPSQRLSHLKQSPKPKSIRLHKTSLYRN